MIDIHHNRALVVGYEGEILKEARQRLNVVHAISADRTADTNWNDLQLFKLGLKGASWSKEMLECFDEISKEFLQFSDINSRQHYYVTPPFSNTYNRYVLSFIYCYNLLTNNRADIVIFANIPHEGFDFIIYCIAKYLKIKTIMCCQSLFPNRFWIVNDARELGNVDACPALFERENIGYKLPENWFYMTGLTKDASYSLTDSLSEIVRKPWRFPVSLIRYFYAREYRQNIRQITKQKKADERYIYFPLHLQPELTTSALGGMFADQMLALEYLDSWVPPGVRIYAKENPKQTEKQRDPYFYRRLAALKNVVLLSTSENSIELIRGSIGVATITGTAGWEALFLGKPVLTFGYAWYRWLKGVTRFSTDISFEDFVNERPGTPEEIGSALDDALMTSGKGVVDEHYRVLLGGKFDAVENARSVVDSLLRYAKAKFETVETAK